ncbi:phage tail protein [Kitasatospora sp. NPDC093550]|uniref:phage tail protein n=1 Tax=Kitasatospora sp. NPDC093550 TaxID=3364089 RepID=UPI0037FE531B
MSTPVYRYKLTVAGQDHLFGDVSGLGLEFETVVYREGGEDVVRQLPGGRKPTTVSLRHGSPDGYRALWEWIGSVGPETAERKDVTVSLLDGGAGAPQVTWTVHGAFPVALTSLVRLEGCDRPVIGELVLGGDGVEALFQE